MPYSKHTPVCISEVPAHIVASWSPAERKYFEEVYDRPRLGPQWVTAHRQVEMKQAGQWQRDFFAGYWPHNARDDFERFKHNHFDCEPTTGHATFSTLAERISRYYPGLFPILDARLIPLFEAEDTHPFLSEFCARYAALKASYYEGLAAAKAISKRYAPDSSARKRLHDDYKAVFASICGPLGVLLDNLCRLCRPALA